MHFSTFAMQKGNEYSIKAFYECLFKEQPLEIYPSTEWSDDSWSLDQKNREFIRNDGIWVLNSGKATGTLLGGNLCTLNLLQGTEYMPSLENSILFLEDDYESLPHTFDRDLQSLIHMPNFGAVRGIAIGRFQKKSQMTKELLSEIVHSKRELRDIPVLANVDFGHTSPMITFPIGGVVAITSESGEPPIVILKH